MQDAILWFSAGVLVSAFAVLVGLGLTRVHSLNRRVGSFACAARPILAQGSDGVRATPGPEAPTWSQGVAHYGVGRLDWWRIWSLSPRPAQVWDRSDLVVLGRRGMEAVGRPDLFEVRCRHRGSEFELAMSRDAYAGMMSWLESAPPRSGDRVI